MSYYNGRQYTFTWESGRRLASVIVDGTKLISYTYDAWGNFTTTYHNGCTSSHHANLNPFRYRGYYYDADTGLYYLQSRYYDPTVGRFLNADVYISTGQGLLDYNMFAYCGNNPVTGYDPTGCWDWGIFTNIAISVLTGSVPDIVGAAGGAGLCSVPIGAPSGLANNLVNAVYFTFISDGNSDLDESGEYSAYADGYISRWERLDYAKKETTEDWYSFNAWRYYSEYSLHMYGWYMTGWAEPKSIPLLTKVAGHLKKTNILTDSIDPNLITAAGIIL